MSNSARKFLLHQLNDSDEDESSIIEWELPTRRKFISLTGDDLFGDRSKYSFTSRKSQIKIDESPLFVNDTQNIQNESKISSSDDQQISEISEHNRYSMRKSQTNNLIDKTIQKIFAEQTKMKEEIERQFKQFNEYKEIESMEREIQKRQEIKSQKESELKATEFKKEEERKQNLDTLETEKETELQRIKEMISKEFSKRNDELFEKQNEIENLKQKLEEKISDQSALNNELREKASENETIIHNLKNKVSELQTKEEKLVETEEIKENKKEISLAETEIKNVEMKQKEILDKIEDTMELKENLENEQKELKDNEIELENEQNNLEIEKKEEIKKRSKNAYKKFDIRRANIIMECEIDFENIRKRKSLLNTDDMMENIKLKMRKQFKEQMMKLRLQIKKNIKLPYTKINNSFFGTNGDIVTFQCSPNNEMCACIGCNGIFHIIDIKTAEGIYLQSLKQTICNYSHKGIENIKVIQIEWDKDSVLLGILLENCEWIGIWNSLTKHFYEFSVDNCDDIITSFALCTNKLLLGMQSGDIYIKNIGITNTNEENTLIQIKNKMLNNINICRWSMDDIFGVMVNNTHIAITNDVGLTVERIASTNVVSNIKCGMVNDKNVLTVISCNHLIFHGIIDKTKRKLMTFDSDFGSIINHFWCNDSVIIGFQSGNIIVLNAKTYNNKHLQLQCSKTMIDMDGVYFQNIGYIIGIIDDKCIRFFKLIDNIKRSDSDWELIAMIDYTNTEWIVKDEIPIKVQLTANAKYSIVVTNKGTMIIYKLMM